MQRLRGCPSLVQPCAAGGVVAEPDLRVEGGQDGEVRIGLAEAEALRLLVVVSQQKV